jgi:hypothetical protein
MTMRLDSGMARGHLSLTPLWLHFRNSLGAMLRISAMATSLLIAGTSVAQECPLIAPLIVKDLQGGIVGQTGTVWTVAPDCSFTVARQIGASVTDPHRQGRLTLEQQKRLGALMDGLPLPAQLGGAPQVNAHQITVSYGQNLATLALAPGGGDLKRLLTAMDKPSARVLELADALRDMIGS